MESQKHMDNKTEINTSLETHYISVCTKFEKFILIHEVMNADQMPSYAPLELLEQVTKS